MVGDPAPGRLVDLHDVAALAQVEVVVEVLAGHGDAGGHPGLLQAAEGLAGGLGPAPLGELLVELVAILQPALPVREARVVRP